MALQSKSSFRVKNISEGHLMVMPDKNDWTRNKISLLKSQVFEFLWSWKYSEKANNFKEGNGRSNVSAAVVFYILLRYVSF